MRLSWLNSLKRRMRARRRRAVRPVKPQVEICEDRTLLSANVSFFAGTGELLVVATAGEDVAIGADSASNVEVLIDGIPYAELPPIQTSLINEIRIEAGDGDNALDISGVTSAGGYGAGLAIVVNGGHGNDTLTGSPDFAATLNGGHGNDSIISVDASDTIQAGDGDDTVLGGLGDDSIVTGDGNDSVTGDDGDDTVIAGDGQDTIQVGLGDDSVDAGDGDDWITGGEGNDTLGGGSSWRSGNDTIDGGDGDDQLFGGTGDDSIMGGTGNDLIRAQGGDDTLNGVAGTDTLDGGPGNDAIRSVYPQLTIDDIAVSPEGDSGTSLALFTVRLSEPSANTITVDYVTADGTAQAGLDYQATAGTLTIAPGATSGTIAVPIIGDTLTEFDETFTLNLSNPQFVVPVDTQAQATIFDDDDGGGSGWQVSPNVNVSRLPFNQAETTIAINPTNPLNMIAASNDLGIYGLSGQDVVWYTFDGGQTWNMSAIPNVQNEVGMGDPTVVFDRNGTAYYAHLTMSNPGQQNQDLDVAVVTSTDGGQTWSAPVKVPSPTGDTDKEFLAVGPDVNNPSQDRIYLAYHVGNIQYVTSSTDGVNWTQEVQVQDGGAGINAQMAVDANGVVYMAWQEIDPLTPGFSRILVDRSFDGGQTWGTDIVAYVSNVAAFNDVGGGQYTVPAAPFRGMAAFLSMDVDRSSGPYRGRVYLSIVDQGDLDGDPNTGHDDTDVFVIYSSDQGQSWSGPVRVNDDTTNNSQFLPWLAVDQTTGDLAVIWYDARNDQGAGGPGDTNGVPNDDVQLFATVSHNGGASFLPNVQLSEGASNALAAPGAFDYGEYNGVVMDNGTLYAVWSDNSNSTGDNPDGTLSGQDVYFATASIAPTTTGAGPGNAFGVDSGDTIDGGDGNDTVVSSSGADSIGGGLGDDWVESREGDDQVFGSGGRDTLVGGSGDDYLDGQGGSDLVDGGDGNDYVSGGSSGNDHVIGGLGDDIVGGGAGNDTLEGGDGNDSLFGAGGGDSLDGGAGDDYLKGQGGDGDTLVGGDGLDIFVWNPGNGNDVVDQSSSVDQVLVSGTTGADQFVVSQDAAGQLQVSDGVGTLTVATSFVPVQIDARAGNDSIQILDVNLTSNMLLTVNGGGGDDLIDATGAHLGSLLLTVDGGYGSDTINGSTDAETILGGAGADVLNGREGDDSLNGNDGNDTVYGDAGNDTLAGSFGHDWLDGGDGDDSLLGQFGNDTLSGGAGTAGGNDTLNGGIGDDYLFGGVDQDELDGGDGNDYLSGQGGHDTIRGGDGNDTVLGSVGDDILIGGDGNDWLDGAAGQNMYNGADGDDTIVGGFDDETILGGDGNDYLFGNVGNDVVLGGDGDDWVDGQSGSDTVAGNQGSDTVLGTASEIDETFTLPDDILQSLDAM